MFRKLQAAKTKHPNIRHPLKDDLRPFVWQFCNYYRDRGKKDIVILSAPRSGSTWLMEMISKQPGIKYINEPLYKPALESLTSIKARWVYGSLNSDEESILKEYFNSKDKLEHFTSHNIFQRDYKFFIERRVIKIIRASALINWFEQNFQFDIVFLIRHPIAESLSCIHRGHDCRLDHYISDEKFVSEHLSNDSVTFIRRIMASGSKFEQFVTEWCLHNLVPLNTISDQDFKQKWLTITYEQLVMDPETVLAFLFRELSLKSRKALFKAIAIPSRTTDSSTKQTKQSIVEHNKDSLIGEWREKVTDSQERQAFEILERFSIDAYSYGRLMPNSRIFVKHSI